MKTFLNVLYRRILYKIPLKLLLVLLAVFSVFYACFSSALNVEGLISNWQLGGGDTQSFGSVIGNFVCFKTDNSSCTSLTLTAGNNSTTGNPYQNLVCLFFEDGLKPSMKNNTNSYCVYSLFRLDLDTITEEYCSVMSSLECQTEYNLIPINSVDQNYCTTNNLCPTYDCPINPIGTGTLSNLYINNILHIGAPNIIMNIPDEIDWDYAYTQGGQNMNIDIVGYNVDYEKIDSIVQFQNYKPSSEDFQRIISLLAPYTKIIVFFVFLFIIWAWIKKPFKSKKL